MIVRMWKSVVGAGLLLMLAFGVVRAEDPAPPPVFVPSQSLLDQLGRLEAYTAEQRGLALTQEIERVFPARAELVAYLEGVVSDPEVQQALAESLQFYRAFDLITEDVDLVQLVLDLLADQVAGLYDPETRQMKTIMFSGEQPGDRLPVMEQIIYVHEFVHALQDANFGLESLTGDVEQSELNPDRTLAITALIEGDASAIMNDFTIMIIQDNPLAAIGLLGSAAMTAMPEGIPQILMDELLMPYIQGEIFIRALIAEGGWELVNAAYQPENLPQSTEQILHPEKYLAGEAPIEVDLLEGELALSVLGDDGWAMLYDRPMGEFYLREYLRTQLTNREASAAARGWGGDRYQLYYNDELNQRAWVMRVVWDSVADADDFFTAYLAFGDARFGDIWLDDPCWQGEEDAVCVLRENADTLVIAYAPLMEQAKALIGYHAAEVLAQ